MVTPLCLGTMKFARSASPADSRVIVHTALDAAINFIDAADAHTRDPGESTGPTDS